MEKWSRFDKFLHQFCFFLVLGMLAGVLVNVFLAESMLTKYNYFDLAWSFCGSVILGYGSCHLIVKAKRAGPGQFTEDEAKNQTSLQAIVLESAFFFGIFLLLDAVRDVYRETPEYMTEYHYGVGLAAILALVLTTINFAKNRHTKVT